MVESDGLLIRYTGILPYRGFESPSLRKNKTHPRRVCFVLYYCHMAGRKPRQKKTVTPELPVDESTVLIGWPMPEFEKYTRSKRWYWVAGGVVALVLLYAVLDGNFLFAFLTVLLALIVVFHEIKQPRNVYFTLTETSITLDMSVIPHKEISVYWLAVRDGQLVAYFDFKNVFRPRVVVPIPDEVVTEVATVLDRYLEHDEAKDSIPRTDSWARRLKL